jgi:hypothetical protein
MKTQLTKGGEDNAAIINMMLRSVYTWYSSELSLFLFFYANQIKAIAMWTADTKLLINLQKHD